MNVHLVKHDKSGVGYGRLIYSNSDLWRWEVRFWQKIDNPVYFPSHCFSQGDLVDLGLIDDTEKLYLFT